MGRRLIVAEWLGRPNDRAKGGEVAVDQALSPGLHEDVTERRRFDRTRYDGHATRVRGELA
jgi:hypothetical protein